MSRKLSVFTILFLVGIAVGQEPANDADKKARAIIEQFCKAFKAGDADACMKFFAVPFNLDGREFVKDKDGLRSFIEGACAKQKKRPFDKLEIQFVKSLSALEKEKGVPKSRGVSFADVLDREKDRMILAYVITGERREGVLFGVRFEKEGAKIVGLFD